MQIEDGTLVKWLWEGLMVLIGSVTALMIFILRGYRTRLETVEKKVPPDLVPRLKTLEEKMSNVATMPQVKQIADEIKHEFKDEHKTLLHAIKDGHAETREYIKDMLDSRQAHWNGRDRRKQ